jgi:hypothetical protein
MPVFPFQLSSHSQNPQFTLLFSFFVDAATCGYMNAFGVFQDFYTRNGTSNASTVSWIGSTQGFLLFFASLPGGKLLDMGYFRLSLIAGSILYTFRCSIRSYVVLVSDC